MKMNARACWVVLGAVAIGAMPGAVRAEQVAPEKPAMSGPTYRVLTLPKVRVEPALVDFGDVRPGTTVSQDVQIFNESEKPIRIARTVSTCRCTVATPTKEDIAPGESVSVTITLDTGELTGPVTRYIQMQFEGGARPLAIGARAYISEGIRGELRYEFPDRDDVFLVDLVEPSGRGFRVLNVSGNAPVYATDAPGADEALAVHHLRLERTADEKRLWLAIETDHPEAPLVVIPVDPDAMGDFDVRPTWIFSDKRIIERHMVPGEERDIAVNLRGISADKQGEIDLVRVLDDRVKAEVIGAEPAGGFAADLHVAMTPGSDVRGLVHTMIEVSAHGFTQAIDLILLVDRTVSTEGIEPAIGVDEGVKELPEVAEPVDVTPDAKPFEEVVEPAVVPTPEPEAPVEEDVEETESQEDEDDDDGWAPITLPGQGASRN